MDALIGWTGFVGTCLSRQHGFSALFNSRNIADSAGGQFGTVACAAAPGSMMDANRFPERDAAIIDALSASLSRIRAERFVLISTIAVLADFAGQDDETTDRFQQSVAYGRNRRALEVACAGHFPRCLVVRLPALFGHGLRKNFIFDMLNPVPSMLPLARLDELRQVLPAGLADLAGALYQPDERTGMIAVDREALAASGRRVALEEAVVEAGFSAVGFTNPETRFQYYDMERLWTDIGLALDAGLDVLHLAPEPLRAGDLHQALTGRPMAPNGARLHKEDMRTRHAGLWERTGPYIDDAPHVLAALTRFFKAEEIAA